LKTASLAMFVLSVGAVRITTDVGCGSPHVGGCSE
jgi:hypothetical protein